MSVDGWFPVALSGMIAPGTSAGVVVQGIEIVVWRDTSGRAHAWEDRCPHRGMKMSFGFVRGDHIACLYHGWEYDTAGQCRKIPAHPELEVPKTICMTTYGCVETGGMIWAGLGDAGHAPVTPDAIAVRSVYVDAAQGAVLSALPGAFGATGQRGAAPLIDLETPEGRVLVGVQPVGPDHTALHVTAAGGAVAASTLISLARRATVLRDSVETGVPA